MSIRTMLVLAALVSGNSPLWADNAPAQKKTALKAYPLNSCTLATDVHVGFLKLGDDVSAVSGPTYGSSQCRQSFLLEARWSALPSPPEYRTHAFADWAGEALTPETCTSAVVSASFYGYEPARSTIPARWVDLGTKKAVGEWTGFGKGWCSVGVGIELDPAKYEKLRVAAKASTGGSAVKKVRAGVSHARQPR